jgi:aryl-alcohol dehydrogenase-like predicted oxidoreductase
MTELRQIGQTDIFVTPVALGCWPIAGMTSIDVNQRDSLATLQAAFENGINFFDTAYCYGANGESERLIAQALQAQRESIVIATKCGIHWDHAGNRVLDARPATLLREFDESLRRLNTDRVELLYLHAPDPQVPVAESAGTLKTILDSGKARAIGVSNFDLEQLERFQAECPISAVQPPYNMLQRQIEQDILPWCQQQQVSAIIYWPLMKGLLAGRLARDHQFAPADGRAKYPMFQGAEWQKNQDFVDVLRGIAERAGRTVAQVVVNWTIQQPGITVALCGAKRAYQITETAGALGWQLTPQENSAIAEALLKRGDPLVRGAV